MGFLVKIMQQLGNLESGKFRIGLTCSRKLERALVAIINRNAGIDAREIVIRARTRGRITTHHEGPAVLIIELG